MGLNNTPYDLINLSKSETVLDIVKYSNTSSNGVLAGGLLVALFFIILTRLGVKDGYSNGLLVSSWICFIVSLFLKYAGLINDLFVLGFLIMTGPVSFFKVFLKS